MARNALYDNFRIAHQEAYREQLNRDVDLLLAHAENDQADLGRIMNRRRTGWLLGFAAGCVVGFLAMHAFWRVAL